MSFIRDLYIIFLFSLFIRRESVFFLFSGNNTLYMLRFGMVSSLVIVNN